MHPTIPLFNLQERLRITIYGPYDKYKNRLKQIANFLQTIGYKDVKIVSERRFRKQELNEPWDIYIMERSYHFVKNSNVNIFIFYYNAFNDSMNLEFKEMCDKNPNKISCSLIFIPNTNEKDIRISPVLKGQVLSSKVFVMEYSAKQKAEKIDNFIKQQCKGYCNQFLIQKSHSGEIQPI